MTLIELVAKLTHIWLIYPNPDGIKDTAFARADIYDVVKKSLDENELITGEWDNVFIESTSSTVESLINRSVAKGSMLLEDLNQCIMMPSDSEFINDAYADLCGRVSTALNINSDDINPDFWDVAFEDDLSALTAVLDTLK